MRIIPTICISQLEARHYDTRLFEGSAEMYQVGVFGSVADCIQGAAQGIADDLALYCELRFRNVSLGTFAVSDLLARHEAIAAEAVSRVAEALGSCEE